MTKNAALRSRKKITRYTFTNVTTSHTIRASFIPLPKYTISASAGVNGSIDPSGEVEVISGSDQSFTIEATTANYHLTDVLVDGVSVGEVTSYTFINVTEPHTILASFYKFPWILFSPALTHKFHFKK